jgi:putative membrane protein
MLKTMIVLAGIAAGSAARLHLTTADVAFVDKAAAANSYELQSAQLAMTLATNDADKQYAQMITIDHTKLGSDVQAAVARSDNAITLASTVDAKSDAMLARLRVADTKFAAEYRSQMIATHEQALAMFKAYVARPSANRDVKAVISAAIPTIEKHLTMAKALPGK